MTWKGHPLYLFAFETLTLLPNGKIAPQGSGNGITAFGGKFRLVVNP